MLALLGTAITASFLDSLNPSAIAQQMLLQAMVKKKRHTLYFILGISLANCVLGIAIYYGVVQNVARLWNGLLIAYPFHLSIGEVAAGIACLTAGGVMTLQVMKSTSNQSVSEGKVPNQLKPGILFVMGAVFCGIELTSALPYFGFLAILTTYQLSAPYVLAFITLYTFIYAFPLILVYFTYNRIQGSVLIKKLEKGLSVAASYIVPVAVGLLGFVLLFDGSTGLI